MSRVSGGRFQKSLESQQENRFIGRKDFLVERIPGLSGTGHASIISPFFLSTGFPEICSGVAVRPNLSLCHLAAFISFMSIPGNIGLRRGENLVQEDFHSKTGA